MPDDPNCLACVPAPSWPEELEARLVDEDTFAAAYEAVPEQSKALVKRLLADLYLLRPPQRNADFRQSLSWKTGWQATVCERPRSAAVVLLGPDMVAPAPVLAALYAAQAAGVAEWAVVRLGTGTARGTWPHELVCACELAGCERLYSLSPAECAGLLAMVRTSGGVVVGLGDLSALEPELARFSPGCLWRAPLPKVGLIGLAEDSHDEDSWTAAQAAAFAYAGCDLRTMEPEEAVQACETDTDQGRFVLAVAPAELHSGLDGVGGLADVLVSPARAGFWDWPGLEPGFFQSRSLSVSELEQP